MSAHPYSIQERILLPTSPGPLAVYGWVALAWAGAAPPAWRAHLDFKRLREDLEGAVANCADRASQADPRAAVALYEEWLGLQAQVGELQAERNANAKQMKAPLEPAEREALVAQGKALKGRLAGMEAELAELEGRVQEEGRRIPNETHPDAPRGGEDASALVRENGAPRDFAFAPRDHVELAEGLDLVDFNRAAQVSGQKFYYLKNEAAMLELALVNWTMQKLQRKGFTPMMTPDLVREGVLEKCGFQPRGETTQVYSVQDSDLCLAGTAEIPLGGYFMDQILPEDQLPMRLAAFGHCFRTEAGAAGAAGKGLYRVHQFSKVEMFVVGTPEQSEALHQELLDIEVELFSELGLHFKVLDMASADLGAPAYRKFDVEAWMPGLGRYGEISSASNCTDYQARRLNIRYKPAPKPAEGGKKPKKQKNVFVHTLNGTACAVSRMLVAILESHQEEDGSISIPETLWPYTGGLEKICPKETEATTKKKKK